VVNNLVDNALKYTPGGGQVRVEVWSEPSARRAVLRVSDTGEGIAAEDVPHIFERFYRGDKSRPHEGARAGYGLGLSICQAIVGSLGGTITVQSERGRGSVFLVSLPLGALV
jgi:signal transduction histidine kinase